MTNGAVSMRAATNGSTRRNSPVSMPRAMIDGDQPVPARHDLLGVEAREVGKVLNLGVNQPEERSELRGPNERPVRAERAREHFGRRAAHGADLLLALLDLADRRCVAPSRETALPCSGSRDRWCPSRARHAWRCPRAATPASPRSPKTCERSVENLPRSLLGEAAPAGFLRVNRARCFHVGVCPDQPKLLTLSRLWCANILLTRQ